MVGKLNFIRILLFSPLLKLRADQEFKWGDEQQRVFENIKNYMKMAHYWFRHSTKNLLNYIHQLITAQLDWILMHEFEEKERVVFYLSRKLLDVGTPVEKLCLCLYFSCMKLRYYLLSGEWTVVCKADVVKHMLSIPILNGKIGNCIFALTEFDLSYESAKVVKE